MFTSETGSGKTLAYLLPLLHRLSKPICNDQEVLFEEIDPQSSKSTGSKESETWTRKSGSLSSTYKSMKSPRLLILTLNKQLNVQILDTLSKLQKETDLLEKRDGESLRAALFPLPVGLPKSILGTPDILISTPDSIYNAYPSHPKSNSFLSKTEMIVFDEADALLNSKIGRKLFKHALRVDKKFHKIQFVFCGATLFKSTKTKGPRATIEESMGGRGGLNIVDLSGLNVLPPTLKETAIPVQSSEDIQSYLTNRIQEFFSSDSSGEPKTERWLLFCNRTNSIKYWNLKLSKVKDDLQTRFPDCDLDVLALQGDLKRFSRDSILADFNRPVDVKAQSSKRKILKLLLCTNLSSRGLDYNGGVQKVINLDQANNRLDYLHRIGRAGRGGQQGEAIYFVLNENTTTK
jgi:superfamily II DNA/RNA helicase